MNCILYFDALSPINIFEAEEFALENTEVFFRMNDK